MPTTYTHAHRFDSTSDAGSAVANAAYNNLPLMTVRVLVRYLNDRNTTNTVGTDACLWSKGNTGVGLAALQIGNDGRSDFNVRRATQGSIFRGDAITVDNTWREIFFTLNRSTQAHTRLGGPRGGSLAVITAGDINSGAGAVDSDAGEAFSLGSNGTNSGTHPMEIAFAGIWDSVLTLAQAQAVADDLSTALQPVAAWKPVAGTESSIPNFISGLPVMAMTGTSLVGGPDAGAAPAIGGIAPTSGPVGTQVTITGTNLTGTTGVTHGPTVAMTGVIVDLATQVRATIAAGSPASGTVRLTTPAGTAIGPVFTITPIYSGLEVTDPNTSWTIGVLLSPILIRALDQFGNTFLGTIPADGAIPANHCGASEISLPYDVTGTLVEPFFAGIATFDNLTPIAAGGGPPPVEVITVATPLKCVVTLFPVTSEPVEGTSGGGIPSLIARTASDHLLRLQTIRHAVTNVVVEPTNIRYVVADKNGTLVNGNVLDPTNADDWQIALTRGLFTPTRGPMSLTLTLVAPVDSTETALQFTLAQGVNQ